MKTALVTGATGQDGFYLMHHLYNQGYKVVGCVRDINKAHALARVQSTYWSDLVEWDMLDPGVITKILSTVKPEEVYNLAAFASGKNMFSNPVDIAQVNGLAVTRLLDAIRQVNSSIRFCQASSSEMFGSASEYPQSETTALRPRTPYGAAKQYAHSIIQIYRQQFGLFACSAILFNHESPLRSVDFVTRKVTHLAAQIKLGQATNLMLGSLNAKRDWGFAGDYMRAMWLMLQQREADDYVVATGVTHSVGDLCEIAFGRLGLDYRNYVQLEVQEFRAPESVQLVGDARYANSKLGWSPSIAFEQLIEMMVDSDLQKLSIT